MSRGETLIRQWNLIKTLQNHRFGLTVDDLAERMECTKRTVQRDLRVLELAMFPIQYEQRDFGKRYWKLQSSFVEREELKLTITELLSLFLSKQLLLPLSGTHMGRGLSTALAKFKTLLPEKALDYFQELDETLLVKTVASHDYSHLDKEIEILNRAILDSRIVNVSYQSASAAKPYASLFHPYGIVVLGPDLFCIGYLATREEIRTLKLSRVKGVELTDQEFERPVDFSLENHLQGAFGIITAGKPQKIIVRFTGWAARSVMEHQWHPSQKVIKKTDHAVTTSFDLSATSEFKRWLLGFGKHAYVTAPKSLAGEMAAELEEALQGYVSEKIKI